MIRLENLADYDFIVPDTETTGLRWAAGDSAFGIAIAGGFIKDGKLAHIDAGYFDLREKPRVVEALKKELPKAKKVVNHHMKFDAHMLRKLGVGVPLDRIDCTMVRAALIDENRHTYDLDSVAMDCINMGKDQSIWDELARLFGGEPTKKAQIKNIVRAPEKIAAKYATQDVTTAAHLYMWQQAQLVEQELLRVHRVERDVLEMLVEVEEFGIRVDEDLARKQLIVIQNDILAAQRRLDDLAGKPTNANSPPQMRALFKVYKDKDPNGREIWRTDKGFELETTDGGEASVNKKLLQILSDQGDERAIAVRKLRTLTKATQFLKDHILGHSVNGRVYPNYNQTRGDNELGTGTGRFSINDPALQQIPARDRDIAALVRPCFLPEKGERWNCNDWKQFEFRWFAHYTNDANILRTYHGDPDTDFHRAVADITGIPRNPPYAGAPNAKQINLGLVFGMGEGEMAYTMGLDYSTRVDDRGREWKNAGPSAKAVFTKYHSAIPGVRQLLDKASSIARARGFVKTALGRRIRFPNRSQAYKAAGLVFQGTSADCLKVKMVQLHNMSKKEGAHYLLSVHDENNLSVHPKIRKAVEPKIRSILETFEGDIACRVPIRCSMEFEANWFLASAKD